METTGKFMALREAGWCVAEALDLVVEGTEEETQEAISHHTEKLKKKRPQKSTLSEIHNIYISKLFKSHQKHFINARTGRQNQIPSDDF